MKTIVNKMNLKIMRSLWRGKSWDQNQLSSQYQDRLMHHTKRIEQTMKHMAFSR